MAQEQNTSSALITLPSVKNQIELSEALSKLKDQFIILVPTQMNFASPLHKVALEAVEIDTESDKDIYSPNNDGKYTLHYKAANKIAGSAGIKWKESKVVKRELDKDGRANYIEHEARWEIKKPNGSTREGVSVGTYNYEEDRKRLAKHPAQIETRRRFANQNAESNAKTRAIFEALELLPRQFTLQELKKKFLVPCVVDDISGLISDPETKKMVVAHALGITEKMYGEPSKQQVDPNRITTASIEVVDERTQPELEKKPLGDPTRDTPLQDVVDAFKLAKPEERLSSIKQWIERKGYTLKPELPLPEKMSIDEQVQYLTHLYGLKDKERSLSF
jgi:hypothetical protein